LLYSRNKLSDALSVSLGLQYLAMFSFANGEEEYLYKDAYTEFYHGNTTVYENDIDIKFNSKASMFSASKMSPLIRFSYQF
jgi:hypothetical protein